MAKKKKGINFQDITDMVSLAADTVGAFKSAQKTTKDVKETKSFNDGNKTNLAGAEGGVSKKKPTHKFQQFM